MDYRTNFKITADIEKYANDENFVLCLRKDVHDSTEEEIRRSIEFYDLFLADKAENKHYFPMALSQLTFLEKKVKLLFKKKPAPKPIKNGKRRDYIIKRCDGVIVKERNLIGISMEIKDSKIVQVITPKYYKLLEDIDHKNHMWKFKKILAGIRVNEALDSIKSCKYLFYGFTTKKSDITFVINSDIEKNILGSRVSYILKEKHCQLDDLISKELAEKEVVLNKEKKSEIFSLASSELVINENIWSFNLYESSDQKSVYNIPEGQYDYIKRDYVNSSFKSSKINPYKSLSFNLYFYILSVIINISNYFRRSHV